MPKSAIGAARERVHAGGRSEDAVLGRSMKMAEQPDV